MSEFHRQEYADYPASKGLRLTREREILVQAIFSSGVPFDAETLIQRLATDYDGRRVSRSTTYRTLTQLEDMGLLGKVADEDDRQLYITIDRDFLG